MRIVDNGNVKLRQKCTCVGNVPTSCNSVSFLTYYGDTSVDSQPSPELKQVSDNAENEGLVFTIRQQTRRAEERFLGRIEESRQINQECVPCFYHCEFPLIQDHRSLD